MEFVLDLLQGAGIAAAIGIRPFLPVLLVGALASADLGIDFDGTDFAFLEEWPFLLAVLVLVMLLELVARRRTDVDSGTIMYALLMLALILGALQGAASLADHDYADRARASWPASPPRRSASSPRARCSAACAAGSTADAQGVLPLYGEGAALGAAGASVLFPPLAILVLAGLAWLLAGGRRREPARSTPGCGSCGERSSSSSSSTR